MIESDVPLTRKQQKKRTTTDALAQLVNERFNAAVQARQASGISDLMIQCRRAALSQPLSGVHIDPEFPVVFDLTTPITTGLVAVLHDTMTVAASELFVLKPSTDPTLTPDAEQRIIDQLTDMQLAMMRLGMQTDENENQAAARQLLQAAKAAAREQALAAAEQLQTTVRDLLGENGFDEAVREGMNDLVHQVAMVLRAPSPRQKKVRKWQGGRMTFVDEVVRSVERVDPVNVYPAPNARGAQPEESDYICEVREASPNELIALATQNGYDSEEVVRAFHTHPNGFRLTSVDYAATVLKEPDQSSAIVTDNLNPYVYQVVCMYGRVKGALLKAMGVVGVEDDLHYEAEVMTIDQCVIRAVLNADPAGRRPLYVTSYHPIPGQFWGRCPTSHLLPLQRAATSAFVSMLADLALSGIHVEVMPAKLHQDDRLQPDALRPRVPRIVKASAAGDTKRAYDMFPVTAQTPLFQGQIDKYVERAYEVTGLQRFALGQTTGVGTVGRTAGGLASLLNQAGKGIKQVMRQIENAIITPVVQHFVDYELMWNPPAQAFSGDVNVEARGMTGVAEQAGQSEDLQWAMQTLAAVADKVDPTTGQPYVPPVAFVRLVYQLFKVKGIPTAGIFPNNFESMALLEGSSAGAPPQGGVPALDGRSQTSIDSINQANDPMGVGGGA